MYIKLLGFLLGNAPHCIYGLIFSVFYPFYILLHSKEKAYMAQRLEKAGLKIKPKYIYKNLFINGIDNLKYLQGRNVNVRVENAALLQNEINGGNPIIAASIHLGGFEMLHRCLEVFNVKVNLITSDFRNKKLNDYLRNLRQTSIISVCDYSTFMRHLKAALRNKEIFATMLDQSKGDALFFDLFNDKVPLFLKLPVKINNLGASVVLFRTFRTKNEHIIRFEYVFKPYSQIKQEHLAEILESWIREYPEQWTWNYSKADLTTI